MSAIPPPPAAENLPELQRGALHDLLTLARACSSHQAEAEAAFDTVVRGLEEKRKSNLLRLDKTYAQKSRQIREKSTAAQAAAQAQAKEWEASVAARHAADKQALKAKVAQAQAQLQAQLRNEICDFSGLWEAVRTTSQRTLADDRQKLTQRRDVVAACRERVDRRALFVTGKIPVGDEFAVQAGSLEPYDEAAARMEKACRDLERVSRASWIDNGGNWVGILLAAIAAGAGGFFGLVSAPAPVTVAGLTGAPLAAAAGGAAAVLAGTAVFAFARSRGKRRRRRTLSALGPALAAVSAAAACAEHEFHRIEKKQTAILEESGARHLTELECVKQRFAPMQAKAQEEAAHREAALDAQCRRELLETKRRLEAALKSHAAELGRADAREAQGKSLSMRMGRGLVHRRAKAEAARFAALGAVKTRWADGCARIEHMISSLSKLNSTALLDWSSTHWAAWRPSATAASCYRLGKLRLEGQLVGATADFHLELPSQVAVPALMPTSGSLFLEHDHAGRPAALDLLRTALARLLLAVPPGAVRLTMIDPVGLGEGFAGFMHLAESEVDLVGGRIWTAPEDIDRKLGDLTDHMENVIQKYLRNAYDSIEQYNAQAGELAEPYRVLVISDFPTAFSQTALEKLMAIVQTGARCGVHVLMACDLRQSSFPEPLRDALKKVRDGGGAWFQCVEGKIHWRDELYGRFPFLPDGMPDEKLLTGLLTTLAAEAGRCQRVEVPFATITPGESEVWSRSAAAGLRIPVGRSGVSRVQEFDLGRGTRQHALVAGKTGSGKSSLLNAIITNLALWYAPDEAQVLLIDFKKGIEFKAYARHKLPHAQAVAIESDLEFGLSVLRQLDGEMEKRGDLFRAAGVQDLAGYRHVAPKTDAKLPRLLLVIDEFQEFFTKDDKLSQDAGALLDRIARQGRAFGIHMLLGSQTLGGGASIPRSTLGQMAVRIALQCDEADAQLILSDTNTAARLLSRPGEAIYNDAAGRVEANAPFQVAWLSDEVRDASLMRVMAKAGEMGLKLPGPIVFEGGAQADLSGNAALRQVLDNPPLAIPARIKLWLGSPVAIKEATHVALGRSAGENLLVAGPNDEAATGVMAAALLGAAAQAPQASFVVLDGTPDDSSFAGALQRTLQAVGAVAKFPALREVESALLAWHGELKRRLEQGAEAASPCFLVIHGLQRYRVLRKSDSGYSFSMDATDKPAAADKLLADILKDGPMVGMHALVWADTHATFDRCFERNMLREFDHRLLLQLSAADSSNLMDANDAAVLGPNRALLFSEERGVKEKCLPYRVPRVDWLAGLRK